MNKNTLEKIAGIGICMIVFAIVIGSLYLIWGDKVFGIKIIFTSCVMLIPEYILTTYADSL